MNVIHIDAKKNAAYELTVAMESQMVEGEFLTGETVADVAYYKDGAGAWTTLAITDTFSEIGTIGVYEISLTAGEMNHDWIMVKCTSTDGRDAVVHVRTTAVNIDDVPTAVENRAEIDSNSTQLAAILADTNELQTDNVPGLIAALNDISTANVATELGTYDGPTNTEMAAAFTEIKGATWASGTDTLEHIRNKQTDIETDTGEIGAAGAGLTNINLPNQTMDITGNLSGSVGSVTGAAGSVTGAVGSVTGNVGGSVTGSVGSISGITFPTNFADLSITITTGRVDVAAVGGTSQTANDNGADINTLLADWVDGGRLDLILDAVLAMLDDARGEPGQGAPPVNPDAMTKIDYLYKNWRNLKDQTTSLWQLYDDAGTTVDQKATVSEAAGTATKQEIVTGP